MITPKLSELSASRPADWGWGVSICIAVLSEKDGSIVLVSDNKVNFGHFSSDNIGQKTDMLTLNWMALYAGDDAGFAPSILKGARDKLRKGKGEKTGNVISECVYESYVECLHRVIESRVLRKYGFTVDSFNRNGKRRLTTEVFNRICAQIEKVNLSLSFLVCGFDNHHGRYSGNIFAIESTADGVNPPENRNNIGLWAIGSGRNLALSSLAFATDKRKVLKVASAGMATYCALEAKFMAESDGQVGQSTDVWILSPDYLTVLDGARLDLVKKIWRKSGAPRVPHNVLRVLPRLCTKVKFGELWREREEETRKHNAGKEPESLKLSIVQKSKQEP